MQNPKEWKSILQLVSLMHCCNVCKVLKSSVFNVNFFIEHWKSLDDPTTSWGHCSCQLETFSFPDICLFCTAGTGGGCGDGGSSAAPGVHPRLSFLSL